MGLLFNMPFQLTLAVFTAAYLLAGAGVLYRAGTNITKGDIFDENLLMCIATLGAFAIKAFPEAVSVMLFYKVGQLLENIAVNNSQKSIKALLDIRPDHANIMTDDGMKQVDPGEVMPGDFIVVKPGERIPLDGIILEGNSFVDTSAITGEPAPRSVKSGDGILSGFVNQSGTLTVKTTKTLNESAASRILELVQNAASNKAPTENFITRFARFYTPAVVVAAVILALFPPVLSGNMNFSTWVYRALLFLVVSCPCALVISIPLGFFAGIGTASRKGILVKGGNYLEALNGINTVVFDKTGTLTKGVFKATEFAVYNGFSRFELLEYAAIAEAHSDHPIAKSIKEAYGKNIDLAKIVSYEQIPGYGVKASVGGLEILAGNDRLLHRSGNIEHDTCGIQGTVVHVAVNNIYAGYIIISDEVREDAARTISALRELGEIRIAMLTGDSELSAGSIAGKLGIDEYYAGLLPEEKLERLKAIKESSYKSRLVFVGDGINDAPVLAMADIGVAMGGLGSDAAIEASDIVLMTDEPYKLVEAVKTAGKTRSIVWQNIIFAMGVKLIVLVLGAGGIATMWEAVFADVGVTLIAVFNALRVLRS